jgi:hypothetical protein
VHALIVTRDAVSRSPCPLPVCSMYVYAGLLQSLAETSIYLLSYRMEFGVIRVHRVDCLGTMTRGPLEGPSPDKV